MLPDTMAKLDSKNKDHHADDTRGKNLLRIPAGTTFFTNNCARIWNAISSQIDINVNLVQYNFNLKKIFVTQYSRI